MSRLVPIPAKNLPEAWLEMEPFLSSIAANSHGKFQTGDFVRAIAVGDMQLWAAVENGAPMAIALTELINYPRQRICRFISANGQGAAEWVGHIPQVERWAFAEGAKNIEALAPMGWEFHLRKHGYKRTHVLLEKPL